MAQYRLWILPDQLIGTRNWSTEVESLYLSATYQKHNSPIDSHSSMEQVQKWRVIDQKAWSSIG